MPRWRIHEGRGIKGLRPADTGVSGEYEQFEVRDGGIGGVVLLTSSYSEAAFENNLGTYLSKRGGLAKLGSLIGLSYDLTGIRFSLELWVSYLFLLANHGGTSSWDIRELRSDASV